MNDIDLSAVAHLEQLDLSNWTDVPVVTTGSAKPEYGEGKKVSVYKPVDGGFFGGKWCNRKDEAFVSFNTNFATWAKAMSEGTRLYWRKRPVLITEHRFNEDMTVYRVICRVHAYAREKSLEDKWTKIEPITPLGVILLGSDLLPSQVTFANGRSVTPGQIVLRAFNESGLTAEEWNAQSEEALIEATAIVFNAMADENKPVNAEDGGDGT